MNTINAKNVASFFNNRVTIDIVKKYNDSRGYLIELWRTDDSEMNSSATNEKDIKIIKNQKMFTDSSNYKFNTPQMCYFSETMPMIMRGPHLHQSQTDWFVTFDSKLLYMFVDENENVEYFITEPDQTYRIKVEPGIIHSYRNLSLEKSSFTANFPSSLFMGVDKKEKIDEVRYEEMIKDNKNIYVLAPTGRLGKAVVDSLLKNMKIHNYNVIPIFKRFENTPTSLKYLNEFLDSIIDEDVRTPNDILINCIAKTNVQQNGTYGEFVYSNFLLPKYLTEFSIQHDFKFIHFSTDYVYQLGAISDYTKSKKMYEDWLEQLYSDPFHGVENVQAGQKNIKIIRLANLFSLDGNDVHNAINKLYYNIKNNTLKIPREHVIMPTDVKHVGDFISNVVKNFEEFNSFLNVSGKPYYIEELMSSFFNLDLNYDYIEDPKIINNPQIFLKRNYYNELDCDESILLKVKSILNVSKQ